MVGIRGQTNHAAIDVLYVDDDSGLLDLTKHFLEMRSDDISVSTTADPEEVVDLLETGKFDVVVSDYQMPALDGLELLKAVRAKVDDRLPFIIFTGQGRETVAMEALNLGANRYLQKGGDPTAQYGVLLQAIEQEVSHHRTLERLREREEHLHITLESIGDGVVTTDGDGRVTQMNPVARSLTEWEHAEALGAPLFDVFHLVDYQTGERKTGSVAQLLRRDAEADRSNSSIVVDADGAERVVTERVTPLKADDRAMLGAVVVFRDITEHHQRQQRQQRQREAIIDLSKNATRADTTFIESVQTITEVAAETLESDRVNVWLFDEDNTELRMVDQYERSSGAHSAGRTLTIEQYPRYFDALETHRSINATSARTDDRTAELTEDYLEPLGIVSMLDATIRLDGAVVGVVCHEQCEERREWQEDERRFTGEIADQVLSALKSRRQRRQERRLLQERQFLDSLLDAVDSACCVLDSDRRLRYWNTALSVATGYTDDDLDEMPFTALVADEETEQVRAALEAVAEDRHVTTIQTTLVSKTGERLRYEFENAPIEDGEMLVGVSGVGRENRRTMPGN